MTASAKPDLNAKQQRFVREYLVDRNATQAAIRAGYSAKTAGQMGFELLKKPEIIEGIKAAEDALARRNDIKADKIIQRLWDLATADPNDLVRVEIGCCRHCHGLNHGFQWRDQLEYGAHVARAIEKAKGTDKPAELPTHEGGFGFNPKAEPHPDCPRCEGRGVTEMALSDTRKLKGGARLLYAGAKHTKYGIEIMMHDQQAAMDKVIRMVGGYLDKLNVDVPADGGLASLIKAIQGTSIRPVGGQKPEDER